MILNLQPWGSAAEKAGGNHFLQRQPALRASEGEPLPQFPAVLGLRTLPSPVPLPLCCPTYSALLHQRALVEDVAKRKPPPPRPQQGPEFSGGIGRQLRLPSKPHLPPAPTPSPEALTGAILPALPRRPGAIWQSLELYLVVTTQGGRGAAAAPHLTGHGRATPRPPRITQLQTSAVPRVKLLPGSGYSLPTGAQPDRETNATPETFLKVPLIPLCGLG